MKLGILSLPALAVVAMLGGASAQAAPFLFSGSGAVSIDQAPLGTTVSLFAGTGGTITDINVSIELDDDISLFWEDMDMFLTRGTTVVQLNTGISSGSSTSGDFDVTFDDEAATVLPGGGGDVVGSFRPEGSDALSDFDGLDVLGTWSLTFVDNTAWTNEGNILVGWSISGTTADIDPQVNPLSGNIPEPGTLAAFGLGLAAFGYARRKRA